MAESISAEASVRFANPVVSGWAVIQDLGARDDSKRHLYEMATNRWRVWALSGTVLTHSHGVNPLRCDKLQLAHLPITLACSPMIGAAGDDDQGNNNTGFQIIWSDMYW